MRTWREGHEHTPGYAIIKHRTFAESLPHDHAETTGLQIGTAYFGCRDDQGNFSLSKLKEVDFVELLATETGLPVGIKSAVGDMSFWYELTRLMSRGDRGIDFVTIDGGEGAGASPPSVPRSSACRTTLRSPSP